MWRDIKRILHRYDNFLLTTHVNPDGDGVGSACALMELLLARGKQVRFVCDSPLPNKLRFLDYHHLFESYDSSKDYSQVQVVITLDAHRRDRIGAVATLVDRPGVVSVCIDHHEAIGCFAQHVAIDSHACSVGAMIYTL